MSLANYLTIFRIFISPVFLVVYMEHEFFGITGLLLPYVLFLLLGISELSDAFDGYVARRYNQVTDFGKILDPMADSIARISVFLTFTLPPVKLPMLLVFIFIYRDSVMSTLRTVCALRGFALAASTNGKIKAILQAISAFVVLGLMIPYSLGRMEQQTLTRLSTVTVAVAAVYTLFSAGEYLVANRHHIRKVLTLPAPKTR